ncbi:MAG: hypothetical protein K2Y37_08220 [Pirellulales bacterium]|nr:hypothetical protein [Pirellulales bacterium]
MAPFVSDGHERYVQWLLHEREVKVQALKSQLAAAASDTDVQRLEVELQCVIVQYEQWIADADDAWY